MGRQVRFYMTPQDEKECLEALNNLVPIQIAYNRYSKDNILFLKFFPETKAKFFDIYAIFNKELNNKIEYESYNEKVLNRENSDCIEFTRSHFWEKNPNQMGSGRFWYSQTYYDEKDKKTYYKSEAFIKWADSCLRWIRRNYKRLPEGEYSGNRDYIGPDALAKLKAKTVTLFELEPDNEAWPAIMAL